MALRQNPVLDRLRRVLPWLCVLAMLAFQPVAGSIEAGKSA